MIYLLDTNIIRFLVGDNKEHLEKSTKYFEQIEQGLIEVEIISDVLMEAFFVLTKFYKIPKMGVLEIPCQSDKIQILRIDNARRKTNRF